MKERTRSCATCESVMTIIGAGLLPKYCSEDCKPRCAVEGCEQAIRKREWCGSHYAQWKRTGDDPEPFKYKWSDRIPCKNCGGEVGVQGYREFCSANCRYSYVHHGGPRPTETSCVACGAPIDLTARGKKGQRIKTIIKFCPPCRTDYRKYKMSARELALRDGTDCGICGTTVDMSLRRDGGLMCPSVDHILPRSRGGTHDPENLQLAHLRCNMRKSDRVMPVT